MKNFLLVFRGDYNTMPQLSPEEQQAQTQVWMNWIGSIAAQGKLTDRGNRLKGYGKVLQSRDVITDGPYAEIKESVMGYSIIKEESLEAATELAKGCPVLPWGNVEVREISEL